MEDETPVESNKSKCALCGKEGALVLFGLLFGLAVIAMSVDTFFKLRAEQAGLPGTEESAA